MGWKLGSSAPFLGRGAGSPSNTMLLASRPTSIPSGILIHRDIWPQQICADNWEAVPLWGGPGSPSNTMWKGPRPTCMQSFVLIRPTVWLPLPSNRHHRSNGDGLEGKRENYQVCSAQYCVQQLCTVWCTHIWTDLTVLWIGFCLTGPISLCLDSFLCMYVFSVWLYIACICTIVTWWGGSGGIEAWSLGLLLRSVLWHCWLGHLTRNTRPRYDL